MEQQSLKFNIIFLNNIQLNRSICFMFFYF